MMKLVEYKLEKNNPNHTKTRLQTSRYAALSLRHNFPTVKDKASTTDYKRLVQYEFAPILMTRIVYTTADATMLLDYDSFKQRTIGARIPIKISLFSGYHPERVLCR